MLTSEQYCLLESYRVGRHQQCNSCWQVARCKADLQIDARRVAQPATSAHLIAAVPRCTQGCAHLIKSTSHTPPQPLGRLSGDSECVAGGCSAMLLCGGARAPVAPVPQGAGTYAGRPPPCLSSPLLSVARSPGARRRSFWPGGSRAITRPHVHCADSRKWASNVRPDSSSRHLSKHSRTKLSLIWRGCVHPSRTTRPLRRSKKFAAPAEK